MLSVRCWMQALLLTSAVLSMPGRASGEIPKPNLKPINETSTVIEGQATGCPGGSAAVNATVDGANLAMKAAYADGVRGTIRIELVSPLEKDKTVIVSYALKCADGSSHSATAELKVKKDGDAWIEIHSPVYDTQAAIAGTAGPSIKKVRVFLIAPSGYRSVRALEKSAPLTPQPPPPDRSAQQTVTPESGTRLENGLGKLQVQLKDLVRRSQEAAQTPGNKMPRPKPRERTQPPPVDQQPKTPEKTAATEKYDDLQIVEKGRCLVGKVLETLDVSVDDDHKWSAAPNHGLEYGLCAVVQPFAHNGTPGSEAIYQVEFIESSDVSWGRLRGTFTAGAAIGQSNGSFTQADPYLSFYVEGNLFNRLLNKKKDTQIEFASFGYAMHFFGEGRLSQTAVSLPGITDPIKASNDDRQSLWYQGGVYFPMRLGGWDWTLNGQLHTWVLGPLAKFGASYVSDGIVTKQVDTTLPAEPTLFRGTLDEEVKNKMTTTKQSLPFYGGGARLGFYRYGLMEKQLQNRQLAPELLGYVDYIYGQDTSLRTPFTFEKGVVIDSKVLNGKTYEVTRTTTGYRTDQRHMLEARLKLPYMPFLLGLDASVGTGRPDTVPSVIRFIVATRVDAASAIGKIFGGKKK